MEELQVQINKLYNDNYIPSLVVYNNLLDKITRKNEMEATIFIYDHMKKNNIKPNDLTFKYINRLHSKTIPESKTLFIKDNGKKKLQPRRRIHKIMKGYNYTDNYQKALVHLDKVKQFLDKNPKWKTCENKIKLAKEISKQCSLNMKTTKYIITNLKRTKFIGENNQKNTILNYFK